MSRRKSIFSSSQEAQPNQQQLDELSDEIDQNLRTLALVHPFSPDEKSLLIKGAFIKPNKVAFHHVIHYLVLLINATHFRKRFRWPVLTSSDESDFRTQAMTYFNECRSEFKWNFGPFKMQIVLFPGGIEIMKIIIELSKLAMLAVLKQNDCTDLIGGRCITMQEARTKLRIAEESFELLESFRSKIQSMAEPLKEKTQRLTGLLGKILSCTWLTPDMIDSAFLIGWEKRQEAEIDAKIIPKLVALERIASTCEAFERCLTVNQSQQLHFDKEKLNTMGLLKNSLHLDPQIDYDKLLGWFQNAMPDVINAIHFKPPWSMENLLRESEIVNRMIVRADELLERIDMLNENWHSDSPSKGEQLNGGTLVSYLSEKLILTPPIDFVTKKPRRIVIWEAIPAIDSPVAVRRNILKLAEDDSDALNDFGEVIRATTSKLDPLSVLNNAMQRSAIVKNHSPGRTFAHSSPNNNNNNHAPAFGSAMICKDKKINRYGLSPMRRTLFS